MEIKYEYVKSMKLAGELMKRGFRILQVRKDKFNPAFDVYVFKKSDELCDTMVSIINEVGGKDNDQGKRSRG